jgi:serine protease inhibitor
MLAALDDMGLRQARASPMAFQRLAAKPLQISQVIQRTHLSIDEAGSEAAAATAVTTRVVSAGPDDRTMVVDKPFVIALRDRSTGLILLCGYIAQPVSQLIASTVR